MRSSISIVLILTLLFSFTACSVEGSAQPNDTTDSVTTPIPDDTTIYYEEDELPKNLKFKGDTVRILSLDEEGAKNELTVEFLTSDVVNDSVFNRELFVEDRLNVNIENIKLTRDLYGKEIVRQHASDEDDYQIYAASVGTLSGYVFERYLTDLSASKHLDLSKPWWYDGFSTEAQLGDALYMATGSLSLTLIRSMYATFYNKELAKSYASLNDDMSELEDLYSVVNEGKWTYDTFYSLGSKVYTDLNGDTKRDSEDLYGIGISDAGTVNVFWSSFDINIFSRTEADWFELDVNLDKLYSALELGYTLVNVTPQCYIPPKDGSLYDTLSAKFAGDTILFMIDRLHSIESFSLRDMQSDYGILPFPKYDERQDEYHTFAGEDYTVFAIPTTCLDGDMTGAVLEALASYSYRYTAPAYLNVALKGKYMNDPQSRKMLGITVDGFTVDSAWIYRSTLAGNYPTVFSDLIAQQKDTFASAHQTAKDAVERALASHKYIIATANEEADASEAGASEADASEAGASGE